MKIGAPAEKVAGEARVALTPDSAKQLIKLGHECLVQKGAGKLAGFNDKAYEEAGVSVVSTAKALWSQADVIIKVQKPEKTELAHLDKSKTLIGFFWPGQNEDALEADKKTEASVIAMDMVPRISRAQKMDALSSMANIAHLEGYSQRLHQNQL